MRSIQIDLPDQLADEALRAGLLLPDRIEALLRQALKEGSNDDFFAAMDRAASIPNPSYMSPEELAEGIRAVRAKERTRNSQ